jgi:hypothetical protein
MTTTPFAPPTQQAGPRPKLPAGLRWSNVWKDETGQFVEGDPGVELPVDAKYRLQGRFWSCPVEGCRSSEWTFEPVAGGEVPCCPRHPNRLVSAPLVAGEKDPVGGARARIAAHIRKVYEARRDRAVAAAQARLDAAQQAITEATKRTAADMRGHAPSIGISAAVIGAGTPLVLSNEPLAAVVGVGVGTVGAVVAYVVAYWVRRLRQRARQDPKAAAKDRRVARHVAGGCLASGAWLLASAAAVVFPHLVQAVFTVLFGLLLMFAVNQGHWVELWAARHRLREMARRKAEAEAARAAEEKEAAEHAPTTPTVEVDESDPAVVGARMAAEWARIARTPAAQQQFPQMARTWIDPGATREITAPIDGEIVRIGWEYLGHSEPGALVAGRGSLAAPIVAQRDWLAAVLFDGRHDPSTVSLVDRPGGAANRFQLMITDSVPLGEPVRWQVKAGVKRLDDGSILVHRGRALDGNDVYDAIYVPGQAFGGLTVGSRGGGKTGGTILYLLNCLAAGVFPILFDPKQLVDYGDFVGVFPIGITQRHRDIISTALAAERKRRERLMARRPVLDEFGREVAGESLWDLSDGPPIAHVWEEFHDLAQDEAFVQRLTNHIRFERAVAMGGTFITQGGGLADLSNSVLRGLLNQTSLTTYRMDDHQARLAGRRDGTYTAADLPKLPGMCLVESPTAPPLPLRTAYVPRTLNHPESVFNQLYGRRAERELLLPPPALPAATIDVFERHGLMDLWEKAKGPGGLDRLLADAEDAEQDGTSLVQVPANAPVGGGLPAADVLLAIVHVNPGCGRQVIDNHRVWGHPAAGGRTPAPSTISRAAASLEGKGKLSRAKGGADYRVTAAGVAEARRAAVTLGLIVDAAAVDAAAVEDRAVEAEMAAES